ncbi:MAG: hypothetical protein R2793_01335 [Flavobacteriaceae bacterium]
MLLKCESSIAIQHHRLKKQRSGDPFLGNFGQAVTASRNLGIKAYVVIPENVLVKEAVKGYGAEVIFV